MFLRSVTVVTKLYRLLYGSIGPTAGANPLEAWKAVFLACLSKSLIIFIARAAKLKKYPRSLLHGPWRPGMQVDTRATLKLDALQKSRKWNCSVHSAIHVPKPLDAAS